MIMDYKKSSLNFSSSVKIGWKNNVKVTLLLFTFLFGSYNFTYANPNDKEAEEYHLKNDLTNAFSKTSTKGIQSKQENSAQLTLTGNVTDDTGSPLPGATVIEIGSSNGVITDFDGGFTLSVSGPEATILVSYLGFDSVQILASDFGDQTNISLTESASALDEIVITGYGRQVKRNITGAVSSISAKQIEDLPLASFENAIQGQMAGVQVTEASGAPGAGASVRVRGIGSISAGNEPLYVVDGFPISKNVDAGVQGDVFRRRASFRPPTQNPLANLNPNDIESIQVLKDASSASIYGSRGSNGVIIITTKRGKKGGAPSFSYNTFLGTQSVANKLDLMNSAQLIDYVKDARNNRYLQTVPGASISDPNSVRGTAANRLADDVLNPSGVDTDWQDTIFKTALVQTHNLSVSGGSDNSSYFISGNLFDQDGIIENSNFKRYSLRVNLEVDLNDRTRVGLNLAPSYVVSDKLPAGSPYFARPPGIVYSALVHAPFIKPYNPDGSINQLNNQSYILTPEGQTSGFATASNPLAIINAIDDELVQNRTFGNIFMEYDLTSDLIFKSYFGLDVNNYSRNFYRANSLLFRNQKTGDPYGQTSASNSLSWVAEQTLNYNKEIGSHKIDALVGYTAQKEKVSISTAYSNNFPDDLVKTINGGQIVEGTASQEEWSLVSMLARVNYSFEDRFLVSATLRSDTSSRFGEGNKTGVFPAVSAGYRISEDIGADWLSDLKLRASWGQTGNFLIPNYASIGLLGSYNTTFDGTLTNGIAPSTLSNQDLSWEKTASMDIGLDFGFLNDRIYGSFGYFNSTTTNLLLAVQVPSALGFTNALTNIGEVVNKGIEISITSRNLVGEFKWTTDFNFSTVNNEVMKLGPSGDPIFGASSANQRHITKIGESVGSFYGYQTDGIYQNQAEIDNSGLVDQVAGGDNRPGDFKWVDVNGDGIINPDDKTVIGNYLPDFTYGMSNRFEYRDLEFSFLIQGVQGNEVLNLTRRHLGNGEANFNSYADWTNRWKSEADPGNGLIPRAITNDLGKNNRESNFQVEDASYLRLRNVTVAYNFPASELGEKIDDLRIYLSGTNLFTQTDYIGFNPEVSNQSNTNAPGEDYGAYPLSSVITVGINAKF